MPCFESFNAPEANYRPYLDFGCGCGRSARHLALQHPRPQRYVGIDLHRGMVAWCQRELQSRIEGFRFEHHAVFSPCLNPDRTLPWIAPFPVEDGSISLIEATSVFTHLIEGQAEYYLDEVARVLTPDLAPPARRPPPLIRMGAENFGLDHCSFPAQSEAASRAEVPPPDPVAIELRNAKQYIASLESALGR